MYPLFLRMIGRLAVVIGGGVVGRRKAAGLLQGGARVRLVSLNPRPTDETSPDLNWLTEPYQVEHLAGATLVFAAATPEVNVRVVADAHCLGLWVCSATDSESGDFITPSVTRRGELTVAVGTGGAAPALAGVVCRHLDERLDAELGGWLAILTELRPRVLTADPDTQQLLWTLLCDYTWPGRIRAQGVEHVREVLTALVASRVPPL